MKTHDRDRWARQVVEDELKLTVELHDDGSTPSMVDFRLGPADAPTMAIECVGAVDPDRVEQWKLGPAQGPLRLALDGDWALHLTRRARIKGLAPRVESILLRCEEARVTNVRVDWLLKANNGQLYDQLRDLGVEGADCYRRPGSGKVYLIPEGIGGAVDEHGATLPPWIAAFLAAPDRADVLSKLAKSRAPKCHTFVIVDYGGAPFSVESYLAGPMHVVPTAAPVLPSPVTGVWLVSTSNDKGIRWTGTTWKHFTAMRPAKPGKSGSAA